MIPDSRVHLRPSFIWDANLWATHMHTVTARVWSPLPDRSPQHRTVQIPRALQIKQTNVSVWSLFDSNFPSTNQWLNYTMQYPNRSKQKKTKLIGWGRMCRVRFQGCLTASELQVMHSAVRRTTQLHQEYLICRSRFGYFRSAKLGQSLLDYLWGP